MQQDVNTMPSATQPLLTVKDLEVTFGESASPVLHKVSFEVQPGERVAIVGQSGSGKSTIIGAILQLLPGDGRISGGTITLGDDTLTSLSDKGMNGVRGSRIGLVPQDPASNLNPAMKVGAQIADSLVAHGLRGRDAIHKRVVELMTEAGIPDAERRATQFPHEFSGGMRQRVLIAIALAREPDLLIADEPTSALDVTVQRQILNHLQGLVESRGTTLLFITHDLGVAADRTDRIIVMLDGNIVEVGTPAQILLNPQHEYTQRLVAAAPTATTVAARPTAAELGVADKILADPILVVENLTKVFPSTTSRSRSPAAQPPQLWANPARAKPRSPALCSVWRRRRVGTPASMASPSP
jgi:peptide/nickel transport system ATP-binding protein